MKEFSKAAFLASNSGKRLKNILGEHLNVLDGMPVQECEDGFGKILYTLNGEGWELYPIIPEWCVDSVQQRIF